MDEERRIVTPEHRETISNPASEREYEETAIALDRRDGVSE